MEGRELQHFFHEHPLILKTEEYKTNGDNDHPEVEIKCNGCRIPISGPFYSCEECRYCLHKVCAELPSALDHPRHKGHTLALLEIGPLYRDYTCNLCKTYFWKNAGEVVESVDTSCIRNFVHTMGYACSRCPFYVDVECASATHAIQDKCHPHPLTPVINLPISVPCNICLVEEKGPSYRCNICPFGVHQNCTLLPDTAKHSDHDHRLELFPSIPLKHSKFSEYCDICHSKLFMFQCIYGCERCLFFAHIICARSETIQLPSTSRDQNIDGQSVIRLPMKQDSTDWISRFVGNYVDGDTNIDNKIAYHFLHKHPLFLIDVETSDKKTCEACAIRISAPSYGCVECDYFLHKCCTDLPKLILHPQHPEHQLTLQSAQMILWCRCCSQLCNSFIYKCSECVLDIGMDIKCGSILEGVVVYHIAHKHRLSCVKLNSQCTACGHYPFMVLF